MNGWRANALVVTRLVVAGLCAVVASVPPPLGFSLLRCLVFVVLLVPFSVAWSAPRPRARWGARAVCARGAVAHCVDVWAGGSWARPAASVGWRVFLRAPVCARGVVLVWGCAPANGVAAIFTR